MKLPQPLIDHRFFRYDRQTQLRFAATGAMKVFLQILIYLYLLGVSYVICSPVLYMLSMAFRPGEQVNDPNVVWIPTKLTLDNLVNVWNNLDYKTLLTNTVIFSGISTVLTVASCCMIGYGFARFKFRGRNFLLVMLLVMLVTPVEIVSIPNYLLFSDFDPLGILGLINTVAGTNLRINIFDNLLNTYLPAATGVGLRSGLYILIFMQFFRGLPREIEEAAYVDGSGTWTTLWRVMLPNAKPALITVFLFSLVWYWNDTTLSTLYYDQFQTVSTELLTIGDSIRQFVQATTYSDIVTWVQCGVFLSMTPLIVLYVFFQRSFVESIVTTGLVG